MNNHRIAANMLFVFLCNCVMAQLQFGPSVFYCRSNFPSEQEDIQRRAGETFRAEFGHSYVAGVFAEYQMKEWFSLQLDVLYDQLNFLEETLIIRDQPSPESEWRYTIERKAEYLSFPLTLQFNYKILSVNAGYQTSLLLYNYERWTNVSPYDGTTVSEGESISVRKLNVSLVAGISCQVYKGLGIELRCVRGLANASDTSGGTNNYYSSTVQYLVGLRYNFEMTKKVNEPEKTDFE